MSDYELRNAREWDAASSVRLTSPRLSDDFDDGFTTVQGWKAKRQNHIHPTNLPKNPNQSNTNGQSNAPAARAVGINGNTNTRGGRNNIRGRGGGRGNEISDHIKEKSANHTPPPTRSSTQRNRPQNAAELASQHGEPAAHSFSFSIPRGSCNRSLQTQSTNLKAKLGDISRKTKTHITESPADIFSVLIWGDDSYLRQAILRLEELDRTIKPEKWAKNHAYDGRKENRRELKAHEEEQATRLQLFADLQEYPFEYSFIWPDGELSLQHLVDTHDRPRGAFEELRSAHQCSIRCDVANSTILIQGMQERDVVTVGRKFESIAREMVAEMSLFIKISLVGAPTALLHQPSVSMDEEVDLKTALYDPLFPQSGRKNTIAVRTPKLWTFPPPSDEAATSMSEKFKRRLDRFNRKTILAGLEKCLTNLHFVQKAVRMQVDFGELAFLMYSRPDSASQHHSFEEFRKTMAKDRTHLLLQAMPPNVQIPDIVGYLCNHPAFKNDDATSASVVETYVVAFDFARPDGNGILRHEQEFGASATTDEMELKRKSWVMIRNDSARTSPIVLSMLDFEKLDWQLRIHANDILDSKHMAKEYAEFEAGVGVAPAPSPAGIMGPPTQRASFPRGYRDLIRVTNKPVVKFRLGKTDHVVEIAREDVYETELFQSSPPKPESKWTASFYYLKWVNDLGEFAYKKHGERPSWEQSLSTFFPEVDDEEVAAAAPAPPRKKTRGPRNFLDEIEEVKNILWEAITSLTDGELGNGSTRSGRIGTLMNEQNGAQVLDN